MLIYVYIDAYIRVYVCMNICMHACMYVCIYVCLYAFVCMYEYIESLLAASRRQRDAAPRSRHRSTPAQVTVDEVQAALSNIDILVEKARFHYNK